MVIASRHLCGICLALSVFAGLVGCGGNDAESSAARSPSVQEDAQQPLTRQASLARLRRLISFGETDQAREAIQEHLLSFPEDPNAMVLASGMMRKEGQIDDAVAMLDAAAENSDDESMKWSTRAAELFIDVGRAKEAEERLKRILKTDPKFHSARHLLADSFNRRGFRFDANEHIRMLCRDGQATLDEVRGLMFPTRAFVALTEKPDPNDSKWSEAPDVLNVARAMYGEGDVVDAAAVLGRSRLVRQGNPAAYAFYGQMLIDAQQYDKFPQWMAGVPAGTDRYPGFFMAMGGWAMRQRQVDAAIGYFAQAVLRESGDLAAIDRMTQALASGGYREDQEQFRKRGVVIDRVMTLTREVIRSTRLDPAAIDELSALLTESGRPLAALTWYRIMLNQMGAVGAPIDRLNQGLAMTDDPEFQAGNRRKQLCGLSLEQFTIPEGLFAVGQGAVDVKHDSARNAPKRMPARFNNVAEKVGLRFKYYNSTVQRPRELRLFEQFGGGVACVDFELDGKVDFYFCQASCEPPEGRGTRPNALYRSLGLRFADVTSHAHADDRGYSSGVTAGDWNQDGFPDLLIANLARNTLLINQGDGTFQESTVNEAWQQGMNSTSVAIADVNGDQLPDIIEINYVDDEDVYKQLIRKSDGTPVQLPAPLDYRPATDRLFLSDGDGSMQDQEIDLAFGASPATGLGLVVTDIDGLGHNEIFVANDHLANHYWQRQDTDSADRNIWEDTAAIRGLALGATGTPLGCMGIAVGDFDQNGRIDFHVTNFENEWNNQYMQDVNGVFDDLVVAYGMDQATYRMLGFGAQAIDYDNNGAVDLVVGNGHVDDYSSAGRAYLMPTMVFANESSKFVEVEVSSDGDYWNSGHLSRALAQCDWNNDGRVDFVVTDLIEPVALLENQTPSPYHWIQLQLVGTNSERGAIGTHVSLSVGGHQIEQAVQTGDGYMCRNQALLAVGLGENRRIDQVTVKWPSGRVQTLGSLGVGKRWIVVEGQPEAFQLMP